MSNQLKKNLFLIQIFSADRLNEILRNREFLEYKNFKYYFCDNLDFLYNLSFENLRFLNIYAVNEITNLTNTKQLKKIKKEFAFCFGFDNFLEYVKLIINYNYYSKQTIDMLLHN